MHSNKINKLPFSREDYEEREEAMELSKRKK